MRRYVFLHTLVLLCILAGGLLTFWHASGDTRLQLVIGTMTTVTYVAWGIVHHVIIGDIHRKVVIEYVLVGLIALVVLATLAL